MSSAFSFEVAKVVGTPDDGFWSQIHTFFPEEGEKKQKRGDLLAVLVLAGVPEGVEAVAAGREVLGRLHEEYYGNLEGKPFERLKAALEQLSRENDNLEIVAAVLFDQALYLAILGEGQVFLKRGEKLGRLLKGESELKTSSGYLKEDDLLVLGSSHFFKVVGNGILRAGLEGGSPAGAVETLAPIVLGRKGMAAAAAILALSKKTADLEIGPVGAAAEDSFAPLTPKKKEDFSLKSILGKVNWSSFSFQGRFKRPIFVRSKNAEKKKRFYFFLIFVFLTLLGTSLFLGARKRVEEKKRAQSQELVRQAEEKLNQAKAIAADRPVEGKVLGQQARDLTQEALLLSAVEEAGFVKEQAEKFLASLGEEVVIAAPEVFMELEIMADGAKGKALALSGEDLVILDPEKKVYFLNYKNKSHQILGYSGEEGKGITASGGKVLLWNKKGVYEVDKVKEKVTLQIENQDQWKEIVSISSYLGHLYLLDKGSGVIWRFLKTDDGYGAGKNWFAGQAPDLSQSVSVAIDGAIWILEDQRILKFNLGRQEEFILRKMPEDFEKPAKIFTNGETENLYVLDKGRGKVYVIDKEGNFKAAYSWEGLKQADDIVAVESSKKLFVLQETKIYEIELR